MVRLPIALPCFPCPHKGVCCSWGSALSDIENTAIVKAHGKQSTVWNDKDKTWRTAIVDSKCFFLNKGLCGIHDKEYYPAVCKLFPYKDVDGGPYKYELDICPELK